MVMKTCPPSSRAARALANRKLKALRRRSDEMLYDIAGMFEEGVVAGGVDALLSDIEKGIDGIKECMDEQIQIDDERERK